jgi:hypothetical protein
MTAVLIRVRNASRSPTGSRTRLPHDPNDDLGPDEGSLDPVNSPAASPIVEEVLRFEDLPLGSAGTRRAVVRWSDGTESHAMTWFADEILVCEGDHGNSRLMSSRVEMRGVAGSVGAKRAT